MAKFLKHSACFLLIQLLIASVVLPFGQSDDYDLAIQDKSNRLETIDGRRLIILGGSNVAFGINSDLIQKKFGLQTVNLGLHAALGIKYQFRMIKKQLREGDVVVLLPEYQLYSSKFFHGIKKYQDRLIESCPSSAEYFQQPIPKNDWKTFLDQKGLAFIGQRFRRGRKRIVRWLCGNPYPKDSASAVYVRSKFNKYGDMVGHYPFSSRYQPKSEFLPEDSKSYLDPMVTTYINAFAQDCKQRGVQVLLSYPPCPIDHFQRIEKALIKTHDDLQEHLLISVVGTPQLFCFDTNYFYDSEYHLTAAGARKRTQLLASALQHDLRISTAPSSRVK